MIYVPSKHTPGTVAVIGGELSRFARFNISLLGLHLPKGSTVHYSYGTSICRNINNTIRKLTGEWLFVIGDDHEFSPDTVLRLLDRDEDYVCGLICHRAFPFHPLVYTQQPQTEKWYRQWTWGDLNGMSGLLPVDGCGGGHLIRKSVFEALQAPWFTAGDSGDQEHIAEDLSFQRKCREIGVQPYVDLDVPIGHLTPVTLSPVRRDDGSFGASMVMGDEHVLVLPDILPASSSVTD